ncbi:hypothetical protein G8O24_03005 [Bradyrhizobium sp. INPA01-394B]|uniref:Uncharacterized protein n=1 Tax=Bradyrhizobium campsiandrae TaxID=1729892 RepID=A0ABR7U8K3_9BRAD|nr:hypothetical protein [Bradyrhizobium campsiandrae]MBC9876314.1 hypothetical protein [Bradyrhizobium campsiandrae]MBC9980163.1 hypothetical protein [Bradyrhizobium campsiandrae]
MPTIFDVIVFVAGFGACWLVKDTLLRFVTGTEAQVKSLEAKLAALRAML